MQKFVEYDGATFKCIACVPTYQDYENIFVAKEPHYDQDGRSYQVINTDYRHRGETRPIRTGSLNNRYWQVNLPAVKRVNQLKVNLHRLVFLAWADELPEKYEQLEVNHKDENKHNNQLDNLELITHAENANYGTRNIRMANSMALARSGHTAVVVAINISTGHECRYDTLSECARRLDLNNANIANCLAGRRHKHKGFVFCHEDEYTPALVEQLIARATRRKQTI